MNQQEFEDTTRRYRDEMFRMYANQSMDPPPKPEPTPVPPLASHEAPPVSPVTDDHLFEELPVDVPASERVPNDYGKLRVMVSTARGAKPVPNASVVITREQHGESDLIATRRTNDSGETALIALPAPPPSRNQQHPQAAFYDISVYVPGYYRETGTNVPIFPNVISLQSFDLIPIPAGMTDWKIPSDLTFSNEMQSY